MRAAVFHGVLGVLGACGRFGFDAAGDTPSDGPSDMPSVTTTGPIKLVAPPPFTTTGATFTDVPDATLTITPGASDEQWLILFGARLSSTSTSQTSAEARYLVDGVERGAGGVDNELPDHGAAWMHFVVVGGTTAPIAIRVQLRDVSIGTARLDNLRIIAFPLPAAAAVQLAETEPVQTVGTSWTTVETLAVAPSLAGRYLILAVANNGSGDSTGLRLIDPTATAWPVATSGVLAAHLASPRPCRQSYFLARTFDLAATPSMFRWEATSSSTSDVSYTRLLAIRTDAFAGYDGAADPALQSSTATTFEVRTSLVTVPPAQPLGAVAIQTLVLSGSDAIYERRSRFEAGSDVVADFAHVIDNRNYRATSGGFAVLPDTTSVTLTNAHATSDATQPIDSKESMIHVLHF